MANVKFEVKGYKAIRGNEGDAFESSFWINGKRAAYVDGDGWGGPIMWRWLDEAGEGVREDWSRAYEEAGVTEVTTITNGNEMTSIPYGAGDMLNPFFFESDFARENRDLWIAKKAELQAELDGTYWTDDDCCYEQLIVEMKGLKKIKRDAKKKTLFLQSDDEFYGEKNLSRIESYSYYSFAWDEKLRPQMVEKHGDDVRILNSEGA
jgi:hypothetical protein